MSEYVDYAWGMNECKRSLENSSESVNKRSFNTAEALAAFKELILSRPDVGFLRTDPEFVLRFLHARKFNVEESFSVFINYYTFMHKNRDFYVGFNVTNPEVRQALEDGLPGVLPRRDRCGRRVLVFFAAQWDPSRYSLLSVHKAIYLTLEYLLNDPITQQRGVVMVVDWTGFSLRQCGKLQPQALRGLVDGLEYSFPIRVKNVHCTGQPWFVQAAINLLKPFLREGSKQKIHFHGHNLSNLHEHIPKEVLPAELGGEGPPYQANEWITQLSVPPISQTGSTEQLE